MATNIPFLLIHGTVYRCTRSPDSYQDLVTDDDGNPIPPRKDYILAVGALASVQPAIVPGPPVNLSPPSVAGIMMEGEIASALTGTWEEAASFTYQWESLANGLISGADASSYLIPDGMAGDRIRPIVTAHNVIGASAPAIGAWSDVIEEADESAPEFELLSKSGSGVITSVPNMRVSQDGGTTWTTLGAHSPPLSIARHADGDKLVISGWSSNAQRNAALFHYEQYLPEEINNAASNTTADLDAIYVRRIGAPAPANTTIPGMTVCATRRASPIGVTL